MLHQFLKIAIRNLLRKKKFSAINIIGLSCGMAVAILIALWIWNELSFNKYHVHYNSIAKVRLNAVVNGQIETHKTVPLPLADELRTYYKNNFKHVVSSSHRSNQVLASRDKQLLQHGVYLSAEAPTMFSLHMLKGTTAALHEKNSIILSASCATAFFGGDDPLNQILTINNDEQVKVTGVYQDLPQNTTFYGLAFISSFELYLTKENWITRLKDPWNHNPIQLYVQLQDGSEMEQVALQLSGIVRSKNSSNNIGKNARVIFDPMSRWHLYQYNNGVNETGPIRHVYLFGFIGLFVLALACINFMNLSTARSEKRAREVGVLKAIGSSRSCWLFCVFHCSTAFQVWI